MRATGIVRRIDDLGRVVIPKEIRRTMRIREGDPLEIYTDSQGEVIFKKYSQASEISLFTSIYADCIYKAISMPVIITDREKVISCAGIQKKETLERRITPSIENIMEQRAPFISPNGVECVDAIEGISKPAVIALPIISAGDIAGSIILLKEGLSQKTNEAAIKLLSVAASFFGRVLEN